MWVAMSVRHAEREMGDPKRENNRQVESKAQADDVHQCALILLCTAADNARKGAGVGTEQAAY